MVTHPGVENVSYTSSLLRSGTDLKQESQVYGLQKVSDPAPCTQDASMRES